MKHVCRSRCHEIGGPFIAEDPDCPVHGRDKVVTIEYWYDRKTRNWVCQLKCAAGYQIDDADYAYRLEGILHYVEGHKADWPDAEVIKT